MGAVWGYNELITELAARIELTIKGFLKAGSCLI